MHLRRRHRQLPVGGDRLMGYNARYTGQIEIDPPLPWPLIKDSQALPGDLGWPAGRSDVKLVLDVSHSDTEDGVLTKKVAVAIEAASDDSFKGYDMEQHIQKIVNLAPDRTYTGYIEAMGEDGAQWRIAVVNGVAKTFTPEVLWPEGAR